MRIKSWGHEGNILVEWGDTVKGLGFRVYIYFYM